MKKTFFKPTLFLTLCLIIFSCSSDDNTIDSSSCSISFCQNGGTLADCVCICPEGYTGTDCSTQVTPKRITIKKVTIKNFPERKDNNDTWDFLVGEDPDIYFHLFKGSSTIIYDSRSYFEIINDASNINFNYTITPPIIITDVDSPYIFSLFDDDITSNENMGLAGFFIYDELNGFPNVLEVKNTSESIFVELDLSYEW